MFGERDLVQKVRYSTGQQPDRLTVVVTGRHPQLSLSDDLSEVFRDHKARVVAPGTSHQMPDLASHARLRLVAGTVAAERKKALNCKGLLSYQGDSVVGPEGLEPPTKAL